MLGVSPVDLTLAGLLALLQRARLDIALLDSMTLLAAVWTLGEPASLNNAQVQLHLTPYPMPHAMAGKLFKCSSAVSLENSGQCSAGDMVAGAQILVYIAAVQ